MALTEILDTLPPSMISLTAVSHSFYCLTNGLVSWLEVQQALYDRGYRQWWLVGDCRPRLYAPGRQDELFALKLRVDQLERIVLQLSEKMSRREG